MSFQVGALFQSMRLPFVLLTPICVGLGVAVSYRFSSSFDLSFLNLILVAAIAAHLSVNLFNEYFDFKSGLDLITQKTPFSGGSGALVKAPHMAVATLTAAIVTLLITISAGLYLIWQLGTGLLPLGLLGVFLVVFYTQWVNKHPWICLIAPGLAFGFVMVMGGQFATSGQYLNAGWLVALVPFFLVNNLLLINQYPDICPDSQSGRNHFPIAFGVASSNFVYAVFTSLAIVTITVLVLNKTLPWLSLCSALPLLFAFKVLSGAIKHGDNIGQHPKYLATNVAISLTTPALLMLSLLFG